MKKRIYMSAAMGFTEELVAIISALILPRMILLYFGSEYNGIISAVTQFIGCIALLKSGIGMATKAALYEPLYHKDIRRISGVMAATMEFLHRVALIFVVGVVIFACIYPLVIKSEFSWGFVFSLVLITSLGTFFQYYFGLGYQLLLSADLKNYVVSFIAIMNVVLNTLISVACIKAGMSIHFVKLYSSIVYCSTPIILYLYVSKKYRIDSKAIPDRESIAKKWDAFGMQVANFVNNNTDIIVASLFLNLKEISVYTVYYLAINGVKKILNRITVGVEAALGKTIVENDSEKLKKRILRFEFILNYICIIGFSCLIILIVPFVSLYTRDINDVNYIRYMFATVACLAEMLYCIRLAYTFVVQAKGAFAETKRYYYIESVINIIFSIVLVNLFGLVGIVLGTLVAMIYRTIMFGGYVYKDVIKTSIWDFIKRMVTTFSTLLINCLIGRYVVSSFSINNYGMWFMVAVIVGVISLILTSCFSLCFYKEMSIATIRMLLRRVKNA